jgi:cell division protein FtsB
LGGGILGIDINQFAQDMSKASKEVSLSSMQIAQATLDSLQRDKETLTQKISSLSDGEERKKYEKDLETIEK